MYWETGAPRGLETYVETVWRYESAGGAETAVIDPDGCMDVIWDGEGAFVVGTMAVSQSYEARGETRLVGVRFRPGMMASCLAAPAKELVGERMWLGRFELGKVEPRPLEPVQKALDYLTRRHGNVDLDWLARQADVSTRQLRRRTVELTGVGPKYLGRILRLRRAQQLAGRMGAAEVAIEAGYCDQSHWIREMKALTGRTPGVSVLSNR